MPLTGVGTGSHWVQKVKGTKEDTEIILPTSILSGNSPFPDPESNLAPFRRTQTFQSAATWEGATLGPAWMLILLPCLHLVFPIPFWLPVSLTDHLWMDMTSSSTSWFSGFQMKEEHLSAGLPQDGRRNCCYWQSCSALRRVRMRKKQDVCFKII